MAKITIIIEDKPNGNVSCICDPKASSLAMKFKGSTLTGAEGYALFLMNQFLAVSNKQKGPAKVPIWLPKRLRNG